MSLAEVRSNILTFLSAGHETTANSLAWSIFLLSQAPDWRARVREEAERELHGPDGRAGRSAGRDAGGGGRGAAALSPDRSAQSHAGSAGYARALRGRRRIADRHRALRAASAPVPVGPARRVRSVTLPARRKEPSASFRLSAFRRRPAHLHRIFLRAAGGDDRIGRADAALRSGAPARAPGSGRCSGSRCGRRTACPCASTSSARTDQQSWPPRSITPSLPRWCGCHGYADRANRWRPQGQPSRGCRSGRSKARPTRESARSRRVRRIR